MFQWLKNLFVSERVTVVYKKSYAKKTKGYVILSRQDRLRLCAEYKAGLTATALAAKYGTHVATVYNILKKHGVYVPYRDKRKAA